MEDAAGSAMVGTGASKAQVGGRLNLPDPLLGVSGPLFFPLVAGACLGTLGCFYLFLTSTLGWSTGEDWVSAKASCFFFFVSPLGQKL